MSCEGCPAALRARNRLVFTPSLYNARYCREDADFLLLKLCLGVGLEDLLLSRFVLVCHDGVQPLLSLLYVVVRFWFWRGLLHFFKLQMGTSVERLD